MSETTKVDIGILTFRDDELTAALERFPSQIVEGRRMYNLSRLPLASGGEYSIAVTRCFEGTGSGDASKAVRDLFEDLAPQMLIIVGIAIGSPYGDISMGDVVISAEIVRSTNISLDIMGHSSFEPEPLHKDVVKWVTNLPARESLRAGWNDVRSLGRAPSSPSKDDLDRLWRSNLSRHLAHASRAPRFITGTVVAVHGPMPQETLLTLWPTSDRRNLAFETSTSGVYHAAQTLKIPAFSIRAINEVVGVRHDPAWDAYACKTAAAFTRAFLQTRPIAPRKAVPALHQDGAGRSRRVLPVLTPFRMSRLHLSNVCGFGELDLPLKPPEEGRGGQWTLLLGDNGVGKTTILRALTLALSPDEVAHAVLGRMGTASPMVQVGHASASIRLETPDGEFPPVRIQGTERGARIEEREHGMPPLFVVAYGSRRGSGLADSGPGTKLTQLAAVETLFDEGASLIQPETWLKEWKLAELQGGPESKDAHFFNAILATLAELLPGVQKIHVSREAVEMEGPAIRRVPLGALSDGYRTTMGWVLDMVARWVEEAKLRSLPVDDGFARQMAGVAIVDEIDLHLHPRWQREVLQTVRRLFPKMSFVVTTHNPLTLLGALPGEIHVVRRDELGHVTVAQRDLAPGTGAERILTGEWFGLSSTLDDGTLQLLEEHRRLIRERGPEAPEVQALAEKLRSRLESFADTSVEKLAHNAAAQVITEDVRTLTPEQRETAQEKIAELLRKPAVAAAKPKARRTRRAAR